MSIVGTRPPLISETNLYEPHHKVRLAEVEFGATEDDQTAAWDMYVELITRITTQSLDDTDGDEETALNSIYQLFPITREILKSKGRNAENFSKIAIIVLNQIIRPFTAKWHKKKLNGAFSNQDECILFAKQLKMLLINELNSLKRYYLWIRILPEIRVG